MAALLPKGRRVNPEANPTRRPLQKGSPPPKKGCGQSAPRRPISHGIRFRTKPSPTIQKSPDCYRNSPKRASPMHPFRQIRLALQRALSRSGKTPNPQRRLPAMRQQSGDFCAKSPTSTSNRRQRRPSRLASKARSRRESPPPPDRRLSRYRAEGLGEPGERRLASIPIWRRQPTANPARQNGPLDVGSVGEGGFASDDAARADLKPRTFPEGRARLANSADSAVPRHLHAQRYQDSSS